MGKHILETNNFMLEIELETFSREYNDAVLHVNMKSSLPPCGMVSGISNLDIASEEFKEFVKDLKSLYDTLKGTAKIKECFMEQYIEFSGDGKGHIIVKGYLEHYSAHKQNLVFSNSFDQTYMTDFVNRLVNEFV